MQCPSSVGEEHGCQCSPLSLKGPTIDASPAEQGDVFASSLHSRAQSGSQSHHAGPGPRAGPRPTRRAQASSSAPKPEGTFGSLICWVTSRCGTCLVPQKPKPRNLPLELTGKTMNVTPGPGPQTGILIKAELAREAEVRVPTRMGL